MSNLFGETEFADVKVDPAYEIFRAAFNKQMKPAKYAKTKGDFEQLARLRRTLEIPAGTVPPKWERACWNYLTSPLGAYSLKDLASRYGVFVHSSLDRYGKPWNVPNQQNIRRGEAEEYLKLPVKPPDWSPVNHDELRKLIKDRKGKT